MPAAPTTARDPWTDRFAQPAAEDLRARYDDAARTIFTRLREHFAALPAASESLAWRGIPMRWSFAYTIAGGDDRPFVYLIPAPDAPRVVLPLPRAFLNHQPQNRASKYIRDTITHAVEIGGIRWGEWAVTAGTQTDELRSLVSSLHETLMGS